MELSMASRMAVPPRESMRAMPSSIFLISLVRGTSRKGSSLKLTMKTSSCGLEALTRSSDAVSTFWRFSRILPLLSTMMPSEMGTSSRRKILMGCSTPFSKTLKDFCDRSVISLPSLFRTLTGSTTRRESVRKVGSSEGEGGAAVCAQTKQEANRDRAENLLSGRIIPEAEKRLERRKAAGLHQLDVDVPILAVPGLIGGTVVQHVLIAKFDSDFCGDVGKFVQVLHIIAAPAGEFGNLA